MNWYKSDADTWKEIIETVAAEEHRTTQMVEKDTIQSMFLLELSKSELPIVFLLRPISGISIALWVSVKYASIAPSVSSMTRCVIESLLFHPGYWRCCIWRDLSSMSPPFCLQFFDLISTCNSNALCASGLTFSIRF